MANLTTDNIVQINDSAIPNVQPLESDLMLFSGADGSFKKTKLQNFGYPLLLGSGTDLYKVEDKSQKNRWFKVLDGQSLLEHNCVGKFVFSIFSDYNLNKKSDVVLYVSCFFSGNTASISINSVIMRSTLKENLEGDAQLNIAIDKDFNVYIQPKSIWVSSVYAKKESGEMDLTIVPLSYEVFGEDSPQFVSVAKWKKSGYTKVTKNTSSEEITITTDNSMYLDVVCSMPINSIYAQYSSQENPNNLYGGTWENVTSTIAPTETKVTLWKRTS